MNALGMKLGAQLRGGEIIELVGDVGAGKTTLTKSIALGMGIDEDVQSPSFTISRVYETSKGISLAHYDFYRLADAGIMNEELHETLHDPATVTVIEWAGIIHHVLPKDRLTISFAYSGEKSRTLTLTASGDMATRLLESIA